MSSVAAELAPTRTRRLRFGGVDYEVLPKETVLDALLRHGLDVPFSCKKGVCQSCLMRATDGAVPATAQHGLKETLRDHGCFLSCLCRPTENLDLAAPDDALAFVRATVTRVERLSPAVARVRLTPAEPFEYRAGQFVSLRRSDGLTRSYSLASVPRLDDHLEIHVKRLSCGEMSTWIFDRLQPGETVDLAGPNGTGYYLPGRPEQPLLLIGNGTGLAPLIGIAHDALAEGHSGPIDLYHGTRHGEGLYLHRDLTELAERYENFRYHPCLSGPARMQGCKAGRAEAIAFADHTTLSGCRVFLCGYPPMVKAAKKAAYLAGAALDDIHADPFELRELRRVPRD